MKATILAAVAAMVVLMLNSDAFSQNQQTTAVPFLLISPDARAGGMGETGTGLADDGSAIFWNVGGLGFLKGDNVGLSEAPWLPEFSSDLNYNFFSYSHYLEDWSGSVAASITFFNLGEFTQTNSSGPTPIGTWHAYEGALTLGYGTQISDDIGLGVNFRFIRSDLSPVGTENEQGSGIANDVSFDLGLLYRPQKLDLPFVGNFDNRLGLGITLTNLGPNLYYIDRAQADPLPTNLRAGLALHLLKSDYNNLYFILDLSRTMVRVRIGDTVIVQGDTTIPRTVDPLPKSLITTWNDGSGLKEIILSLGAEYWYGQPRLIALRWGYYRENPNFGGRDFMTFGAGIRYDITDFGIVNFDFSYISTFDPNNPLSNQLRFSLGLNWGGQADF
ncbi:MAG TPA: PorV/PorQ family protein [Candidatus Acidoferrales bacterium]|nr:PorV/PorQ family protein [Candidatus Acidoferrales bacterium]